MARRKEKVDAAYKLLIGGPDKKAPATEAPKPTGVKLTRDELDKLNGISAELGVSRHEVLQYAIREFMARYARGERPKTEVKPVITLKTE